MKSNLKSATTLLAACGFSAAAMAVELPLSKLDLSRMERRRHCV